MLCMYNHYNQLEKLEAARSASYFWLPFLALLSLTLHLRTELTNKQNNKGTLRLFGLLSQPKTELTLVSAYPGQG